MNLNQGKVAQGLVDELLILIHCYSDFLLCIYFLDVVQMNLNQGKVAQGLVDELLILIHRYDESLYVPTVLGCLELVKQQLINESLEEDDATQD